MISKRSFTIIAAIAILIFATMLAVDHYILRQASGHIVHAVGDVQPAQAALVLGARVYADGRMSDMFRDRVVTAVELYQAGKAGRILVSGDHGRKEYDEVNAAKEYLLEQGIPAEAIFLDHAGFDTYDSLYRAKHIFQAERLVIVTQEFHLPRSLYLARQLDITAEGIAADKQAYQKIGYSKRREFVARQKAAMNVLLHSKPTYLGQPIPLSGDGRASWD